MGIFDLFSQSDINEGIEEFKKTDKAILLDVRTVNEYLAGHLKDSINIPVNEINSTPEKISDKETSIFVYCLSGSRSSAATTRLKFMGYNNVKNIGGLNAYKGQMVR